MISVIDQEQPKECSYTYFVPVKCLHLTTDENEIDIFSLETKNVDQAIKANLFLLFSLLNTPKY